MKVTSETSGATGFCNTISRFLYCSLYFKVKWWNSFCLLYVIKTVTWAISADKQRNQWHYCEGSSAYSSRYLAFHFCTFSLLQVCPLFSSLPYLHLLKLLTFHSHQSSVFPIENTIGVTNKYPFDKYINFKKREGKLLLVETTHLFFSLRKILILPKTMDLKISYSICIKTSKSAHGLLISPWFMLLVPINVILSFNLSAFFYTLLRV